MKKLDARTKIQLCSESLLKEFSELNLFGRSDIFIRTLQLIKQTAKCDASILIEGETGTGKENAARAIHYLGKRQDYAFVPINCGAIPDNLLESEIFGYEAGAFTDARHTKKGLAELANHGTLFLDEVDSLSPKAQAALLRFLQTGEYRPLGGEKVRRSNMRIIAATNGNLEKLVSDGKFRGDLFFRLNVLNVRMPPLRERPEDIEIIADLLLKRYLAQYQDGPTEIHPATMRYWQAQPWPGNVRELENIVLREFLMSTGDQFVHSAELESDMDFHASTDFHADGKTDSSGYPTSYQQAKQLALSDFESGYLEQLLKITEGNVTEAARISGKERRCLGKLIKKHNIDRYKFTEKIPRSGS